MLPSARSLRDDTNEGPAINLGVSRGIEREKENSKDISCWLISSGEAEFRYGRKNARRVAAKSMAIWAVSVLRLVIIDFADGLVMLTSS